MLIFASTMWVNLSWLDSLNSCLCARTKWWLMPSPKACRPWLSSGTARSWLVMLLSPLVYYVASVANVCYHCILFYVIIFFHFNLHFFFPSYTSIIFWSVCPLFVSWLGRSESHYCAWAGGAWELYSAYEQDLPPCATGVTLAWAPTNEILSRMRKSRFIFPNKFGSPTEHFKEFLEK